MTTIRMNIPKNNKQGLVSRKTKCGCACTACGWRGYRMITFHLPLNFDHFDVIRATELIKGKGSSGCCPNGRKSVVFTHAVR